MDDDPHSSIDVLGRLLDRNARTAPDALALTDGTVHLTWIEYRDAAARLAGDLAAVGVGPGDRVAVMLPKSTTSFVAAHAIVRLGAIVVPIDSFAPPAYARSVLLDADVTALVSTMRESAIAAVLTGDDHGDGDASGEAGPTGARDLTALPVVKPAAPDHDAGDGERTTPTPPVDGMLPSDDGYIVYTSGSTGRPKGIVHTHASALAYARAAVDTYGLGPDDRLVNVAPLHFDQSTFELWAAPLACAAVIVLSDALLRFPASASEVVARERGTVWYSVPYAITQLTSRGALDERDLSSLRWVLFGGESFRPGALAASMEAIPTARFSNVYGPAEVNQCTFFHLDDPPSDHAPVPIGQPWSAADLRVVDEAGAPVDGSTPGELLVRTTTMMDRYWNRPERTAAAIVTDSEGRWYRTGDLVERRDDGALVFLGRVDHQVKLRGHRIELEAVEATIGDDDRIGDCAVVVERSDEDRLVALVAPAVDDETAADVLRHLHTRLPRYAVPEALVGIDTIPRSRTGKIDRPAAAAALAETHDMTD